MFWFLTQIILDMIMKQLLNICVTQIIMNPLLLRLKIRFFIEKGNSIIRKINNNPDYSSKQINIPIINKYPKRIDISYIYDISILFGYLFIIGIFICFDE